MFKRMFKGEAGNVFKGMLTLLVGAGLARIIGLLSIPILARIYSPEDFGVLALYTAFIAILVPVMTLRYVQAIPLPKTDVMAFNLFSVCLKLIVLFSIVLTVVLVMWGESVLGWFDMEALLPWWWLIVLGVAGAALYELLSLWATRKKDYKVISKTQFTQSLIGTLVKIGLGIFALKPGGLIIGQFLSQSAGVTSFIKNARSDFRSYIPKIRYRKEKFVVQYYQVFVWYRLPSQVLMVLSVQAPVIMMATLFSPVAVGQFSLAKMALMVPASLIGTATSTAYYAEIAAIGKRDFNKIKRISINVAKNILLISFLPLLLLTILAPWLFITIFGEDWYAAGEYAQVLAPYILVMLVSTPLVQVLNVVGAQFVFLVINLIRFIGLFFVYLIFQSFSLTAYEFVVWFVVFSIMYAVFQMTMVFYYIVRAASGEINEGCK
ncbi:teichoic acid transporter [Halovibrio variabilis]|uniref:Teichoic acid transporter n=1 Tax=Halovibrio variabilis TaxID=31910 RepID=A0A511UW38_9GAMM|nr:oligosaccharide flippase family protein [Halovibrio variabilis]GEN29663.1 teichoic acid transporter [Halovibrio variabilis]